MVTFLTAFIFLFIVLYPLLFFPISKAFNIKFLSKKILIANILVSLLIAGSIVSSENTKRQKEIEEAEFLSRLQKAYDDEHKENLKEADTLRFFKDKYPYDVKFLDNEIIKKHIIGLSSTATYEIIKEYWNVESPITIKDNVLFTTGCQQHNCGATNFAIAIRLATDSNPYNGYYIGTYINEHQQNYLDTSSPPQEFVNWQLERMPEPTYKQTYYPPARTFGSYPCTIDCSGHQAGYDWAEDKDIDSVDDCGGNSNSFIEGCYEYVKEYYPSEDNCDNYNAEEEVCED